jgi:hypothetical protein
MITEDTAELVTVMSLAVAAVVELVLAGGGSREVETQVDAQAREWTRFVRRTDQLVEGAAGPADSR